MAHMHEMLKTFNNLSSPNKYIGFMNQKYVL